MSVRRWFAVVVTATLFLTLLPLNAQAAGFATAMPDANLRNCVTSKLGLPDGAEPTQEQLDSIVELSCTGRGIADATGVGTLRNLTKLFLGSNQLTDATPVAEATKVFSLGLQNNQLSDISALRSLTELTSISVDNNRLSDIAVLGTLPKIERISGGTRNGQRAIGSPAVAGQDAPLPVIVGWSGAIVRPDAPAGVTVAGSTVTYAEPGTFTWSFRDPADLQFNGSVTVEVTAPSQVTVPDDALRACLNAKIEGGRPAEQQPTVEELGGLTGALTCNGRGVTDLTGLNLATGLSGTVNLSNNSISDLAPLSALTKVTSFNLFQNEITSLAGLGSLPNLTTLSVQRNVSSTKAKLVSLAGVEKLTGLTSLTVSYQDLTSLAPLANHPSLITLTATDNLFADVSPLTNVPLTNRLDLQRNRIGDLSPLDGKTISTLSVTAQKLVAEDAVATVETAAPSVLTQSGSVLFATPPAGVAVVEGKVTYPAAGSYDWSFEVKPQLQAATFGGTITQQVGEAPPVIVDVTIPDANLRACLAEALDRDPAEPISAEMLAGLTKISCVGKGISDLTGAELLTGATELVLSTNQIADASPLAGLTGLTKLYLAGNQLTNLGPLAELTSLTELNLSNNPITSITPLAGLTGLRDLDISQRSGTSGHPGVWSLAPVSAMPELTRLVFNNSRVWDLAPVAGLTNLTNLAAGNNQIEDISPLAPLTKLTSVNLRDNEIADISALKGATELTTLGLSNNRIGDLSALSGLKKLNFLQPAATGQRVALAPAEAGRATGIPKVRGLDGVAVAATAPDGVTVEAGMVTYPAEGSYSWPFQVRGADGLYFSGTLTQRVTPPATEPGDDSVHAQAANCLADGNVWVVVERDTGLQEGGCATEFSDGLEALRSAGFDVTGTGFVSHIDGYPSGPAGMYYWSYWHADEPSVTVEERDGHRHTTSTFDWRYADTGPAGFEPQPGTIEGWRFVEWVPGEPAPAPSWHPVVTVAEDIEPEPTDPPESTQPTDPPKTAEPRPFERTAPYTLPGLHKGLNGRDWLTTCEKYSQTERCRTEIWATTVVIEDGRFVRKNAWVFNNLTYLPFLAEAQWKGNPLGDMAATTGGEFSSGGRQWRTECHTAVTGRGGCRSYTMATVHTATPRVGGGYAFGQTNRWVFNNIVLFKR